VLGLLGLRHVTGEPHAVAEPQRRRPAPQLGQQRPAARDQQAGARARTKDVGPEVEQKRQILAWLEPAEEQHDGAVAQAVARQQIGTRRTRREPRVDTVRRHRHVVDAHAECLRELPARELAADDHAVARLDHALFDHPVQRIGVEVMVVGHDRHVQSPPAAGPQRPRPDEAQRVTRSRSKPTRRWTRWMAGGTTNGATHHRSPRRIENRCTVQFGTTDRMRLAAGQDEVHVDTVTARRVSSSRSYVSPPDVVSGLTAAVRRAERQRAHRVATIR